MGPPCAEALVVELDEREQAIILEGRREPAGRDVAMLVGRDVGDRSVDRVLERIVDEGGDAEARALLDGEIEAVEVGEHLDDVPLHRALGVTGAGRPPLDPHSPGRIGGDAAFEVGLEPKREVHACIIGGVSSGRNDVQSGEPRHRHGRTAAGRYRVADSSSTFGRWNQTYALMAKRTRSVTKYVAQPDTDGVDDEQFEVGEVRLEDDTDERPDVVGREDPGRPGPPPHEGGGHEEVLDGLTRPTRGPHL